MRRLGPSCHGHPVAPVVAQRLLGREAITPRDVARRDLETAFALPAIDEEHGHPENSKTRTNVDEQGVATIGEPREGTYGHEHPDDDSDDGPDVSQRVELQFLEPLRDSRALVAIFGHSHSVPDQKERRPMPADRSPTETSKSAAFKTAENVMHLCARLICRTLELQQLMCHLCV
jgi:hypothetical protein